MTAAPDFMLRTPDKSWHQLDAFSDVLRVIRLAGGVFLEAELTAPWCISGKLSSDDCRPFLVTPRHVIASHFVAAGHMQLRIDGGDRIDVRASEACRWQLNGCVRDTAVWRKLPLRLATSRKQRSVVHSNGSSGHHPVPGAGSHDKGTNQEPRMADQAQPEVGQIPADRYLAEPLTGSRHCPAGRRGRSTWTAESQV
jgi:hypothetical protein